MIELLEPALRRMPETRPDTDARHHKLLCKCHVCQRPETLKYRRRRVAVIKAP